MKKPFTLPIAALAVLALLAGGLWAQAQASKKTDVVGTWRGIAVVNDEGEQIEIVVVLGLTDAGYTGKLSDTNGLVPESELRQIAYKDKKLTCEFDLVQGGGTLLIKIELFHDQDTLKGIWTDPDGNTGPIELTLQK